VDDQRFDLYQRAPTVDGCEMNTRKKSIRGHILPNLIDKLCFNIAQHLRSVAEDKILVDRLTLHFKIDPKGMLNFLFCSYIHFTDQTLASDAPTKTLFCEPTLKNPANALDTNLLLTGRPMSLQKQYFCVSCENKISTASLTQT